MKEYKRTYQPALYLYADQSKDGVFTLVLNEKSIESLSKMAAEIGPKGKVRLEILSQESKERIEAKTGRPCTSDAVFSYATREALDEAKAAMANKESSPRTSDY